ncbi:hypothetical protein [Leptothermofonsia sp. ETS-13]
MRKNFGRLKGMQWGWLMDGIKPDKLDLFGGWVVLLGVVIIMYVPRN